MNRIDPEQLRQELRPGQQRMAAWAGGPLAVAAVPGAGKSTGMAAAAALVLARRPRGDRRTLLLVTFTRAAALALRRKLRHYLQRLELPQDGFQVLTLHGLGLQIAQSAPESSGIDWANATLISPNRGSHLLQEAVDRWMAESPETIARLVELAGLEGGESERLRRLAVLRGDVLPRLAQVAIQEAKSSGCDPAALGDRLADCEGALLPAIAQGIYRHYQRILRAADLFDYDDMMLAALTALADQTLCRRWQSELLGVFEDEAQDSSPLQTRLLERLATDSHRGELQLIRVGDSNQAINSSFTPADPVFFRRFCQRWGPERLVTMDEAGRSAPAILELANALQVWVNANLGVDDASRPFQQQPIRPVARPCSTDNPPPYGTGVELLLSPSTAVTTARLKDRLRQLWRQQPQASMAILVRQHRQAEWLGEMLADLEEEGLTIWNDSLEGRRSRIPEQLLRLLSFVASPDDPETLAGVQSLLEQRGLLQGTREQRWRLTAEDLFFPTLLSPEIPGELEPLRHLGRDLLQARRTLPPLQLIPFAALCLGYDAGELATADKLSDRLARQAAGRADLDELVRLLQDIVHEESFEPVEADEPETRLVRPGQLTLITMHKAKGLDWDAVFLPFVEADLIPGRPSWVPPGNQFLGGYALAEVTRAQLRALLHDESVRILPDLAEASQRAEDLRQAEEYRLLYVAVTRARRLLWMAGARQAPFNWRYPDQLSNSNPCPALQAIAARFPAWLV